MAASMAKRKRPAKKRRSIRAISPSLVMEMLQRIDDIEKTLHIQFQRMSAMQAQIDHNAARLRS
jgi:hypothetical protein